MNINNSIELIETGIPISRIPISQSRIRTLIDDWLLHSTESKLNGIISIFGAVFLMILDDLRKFWFSKKLFRGMYKKYYENSMFIPKVYFKEWFGVYDFPLVAPVLLTMQWQKHYVTITGDWFISYETEESMVALIAYSEATGESMHGRLFFDVQELLNRIGITPAKYSEKTFKKLAKAFWEHKTIRWVRGKYHYQKENYTNPNMLGDSIGNIARVPNRTVILKSNDKWSVTHISVITRKELQ